MATEQNGERRIVRLGQSLGAPDGHVYGFDWGPGGKLVSWSRDGAPQEGPLPDWLYECVPGPLFPKSVAT